MAILNATKVTSAATLAMPGVGDGQSGKIVSATYTFATAPAAADVIQSPMIQAGSVITDVTVSTTGFGASSTYSVGYTGLPAYFSALATGVAAGVRRMDSGNPPVVLPANDTVDVTIGAAGATAAGTVTITVAFTPQNA
jgi:hypothetical protein